MAELKIVYKDTQEHIIMLGENYSVRVSMGRIFVTVQRLSGPKTDEIPLSVVASFEITQGNVYKEEELVME